MSGKGVDKIAQKKAELEKWLLEMKRMAPKNIRDAPELVTWLKVRKVRSPRTLRAYMLGISKYVEFTGMTLSGLITEAQEDQRERLLPAETRLLEHLVDFKSYLDEETALTPNSVHNRLSGVINLYKAFHITPPDLDDEKTPSPMDENVKPITIDEIRDVLRVTDPLERALVLVGCASGLSASDITELKLKEFKDGYDPETGVTVLHLFRKKTKVEFVTCLTPEASDAVWEYLKYRNRQPKRPSQERLEQIAKQRVTSDDGYLFIVRKVPKEYLDESLPLSWQERENLRKIDPENTYPHIFARLAEKCQMCAVEGWNVVRSHNFRKYFSSTLLNAGVDSFFVYRMLAHKQKGSDAPYFIPEIERVRRRYIRECVELLTIQKEYDFTKSPVYQEMQQNKAIMQAEIDRLREENKEQAEYAAVMEAEAREALTIRDELIAQAVRAELAKIRGELEESSAKIKAGIEKRGGKVVDLSDLSEEERKENLFAGETEKEGYPDW